MEKKFLCGIGQGHFQGKISSQKFLFIQRQLMNGFSGKFFTVIRRHRRENDFQSEIIENGIIFCTDMVSKRPVKVKVSQGSFRSSQGKTKLIQWYGPANSNGQSASMLFRKITKCSGKSRKTGTVCNSEIISGIAEGVQHDPDGLEKILDLMF